MNSSTGISTFNPEEWYISISHDVYSEGRYTIQRDTNSSFFSNLIKKISVAFGFRFYGENMYKMVGTNIRAGFWVDTKSYYPSLPKEVQLLERQVENFASMQFKANITDYNKLICQLQDESVVEGFHQGLWGLKLEAYHIKDDRL
jgi:hypothetical protein